MSKRKTFLGIWQYHNDSAANTWHDTIMTALYWTQKINISDNYNFWKNRIVYRVKLKTNSSDPVTRQKLVLENNKMLNSHYKNNKFQKSPYFLFPFWSLTLNLNWANAFEVIWSACFHPVWWFARFGNICTIQKTWKKTHGGVLLLVKLQASANSTHGTKSRNASHIF